MYAWCRASLPDLRFQSNDRAVQPVLDWCIPIPLMGVLPIKFDVIGCTANSLSAKEWTILVSVGCQ